jgi:hypothetical protein
MEIFWLVMLVIYTILFFIAYLKDNTVNMIWWGVFMLYALIISKQ